MIVFGFDFFIFGFSLNVMEILFEIVILVSLSFCCRVLGVRNFFADFFVFCYFLFFCFLMLIGRFIDWFINRVIFCVFCLVLWMARRLVWCLNKKKCKMIIRFNIYECIGNIFINLNELWFIFLYIYYNVVDLNLRFCKVIEEWKNFGKYIVIVGLSFFISKLEIFWYLWRLMKRVVIFIFIWYIEFDRRIFLFICMSEFWNRYCLDIIVVSF